MIDVTKLGEMPVNELMDALAQVEDPSELFAAVMALPDEHFEVLAPVFRESLHNALLSEEGKQEIVAAIKAGGITIEQVSTDFSGMIEAIEQAPDISPMKKAFLEEFITSIHNTLVKELVVNERKVFEVPVVLDPGAKMPTYAIDGDVGADIYALEDVDILPGETKVVKTGVHMTAPVGHQIEVRAKSGIAAKTNLIIKNGLGTVEPTYTGDISVIFTNIAPPIVDLVINDDGTVNKDATLYGAVEHISAGQKIAQVVIMEAPKANFHLVDSLVETERGDAGFGSTGV